MKKTLSTILFLFLAMVYMAYESGEFSAPRYESSLAPPLTAEKWSDLTAESPQKGDSAFEVEPAPPQSQFGDEFSVEDLPAYEGFPYTIVHDNIPYFTAEDFTTASYESYSPLDDLGRCGIAAACVGPDLLPTEERGDIGQVKPTGWQTVKYDSVSGKYLYNRCHLIGYQLTGENANTCNLITGTRALNMEGMLPFENMVADYVQDTGNHVLYRVTPVFMGSELLCRGVLMEGRSVEDEQIVFCIYAFNAQPGIDIDYATGESSEAK
jgi:DNA-entry nuclease